MVNISSNYHVLPSRSSTMEVEATKRQPSPAEASAAYLHDDCEKVFLHVMVSLMMFFSFAISASAVWQDRHDVIITTIAFLYATVMIHLVLITRWDGERRQWEHEACKAISAPGTGLQAMLTSLLMLVATGIVIIYLVAALFVFRTDWPDLALIAMMVLVSTVLIFCLLGSEEISRKKAVREKYEDDSN